MTQLSLFHHLILISPNLWVSRNAWLVRLTFCQTSKYVCRRVRQVPGTCTLYFILVSPVWAKSSLEPSDFVDGETSRESRELGTTQKVKQNHETTINIIRTFSTQPKIINIKFTGRKGDLPTTPQSFSCPISTSLDFLTMADSFLCIKKPKRCLTVSSTERVSWCLTGTIWHRTIQPSNVVAMHFVNAGLQLVLP